MGGRLTEPTSGATFWSPDSVRDPHAVGLYDTDHDLVTMVVDYIAPALENDTVLAIVRDDHRGLLERGLEEAGADVGAARRRGHLITLDAAELLSTFMYDDLPDRDAFRAAVGGLITASARTGRPVRVFGEMVGLLWDEGNVTGALALEDLWHEVAATNELAVLCTYAADTVRDNEDEILASLCHKHSVVMPHEILRSFEPGAQEVVRPTRGPATFTMRPSELRHASWVVSTALQLLQDNWPQLSTREVRELLDSAAASAAAIETFAAGVDTEPI